MGKFGRPSHKVKMRRSERKKKEREKRRRQEKDQGRLSGAGET